MRKFIMFELLRRFGSTRDMRKKLGYFALAAATVIVLFVAGVVWVGYSVVNYVANIQVDPQVKAISTSSCWTKTQALMNTEAFLGIPLAQQISTIKAACFDSNLIQPKPEGERNSEPKPDEKKDEPEWSA